MPVHKAGGRLYQAIKFKHLVKHSGSAAEARSSNISLNLVPFVDMMTILVCFLLMVFSSTGALLQAQKGLDLPVAMTKALLQEAPVILVTKSEITVAFRSAGHHISGVEEVLRDTSPAFKIETLAERLDAFAKAIRDDVKEKKKEYTRDQLKACEEVQTTGRSQPGRICPEGLAILQADEGTDIRVINKIVNTAKSAGFENIMFAIKNK
jgi:biopolymer transport protein ExbD